MLKLIILDFDGVIVESTDIKTEAFRKLFSDYPKQVDTIVEYHKKHAGVNRYEKFNHIYKNILRQSLDKEKMAELGRRFSALVVDEIKACPLVPGALEFLKKYSKMVKLFIASSTPEEELMSLVKARDLQRYFKGIYGAPSKKSEITLRVIKEEGAKGKEVLFVGDSAADHAEAKKAGVHFIGRVANLADYPFPEGVKTIKDLTELGAVVEELSCQ
jgi:HAD superfamily hydrolase (TIGR01549 family)